MNTIEITVYGDEVFFQPDDVFYRRFGSKISEKFPNIEWSYSYSQYATRTIFFVSVRGKLSATKKVIEYIESLLQ